MTLETHIADVQDGLSRGRFNNEASISQGVVLRLLNALDWPTYDTEVVWPEYSVEGRRVDFALCHPPRKPLVFVEVKQTGQSNGADRQLFEYAFHLGVPMAIMTDGREWHFYLPGEQGAYQERRVYMLDLLERSVEESAERLSRYLTYHAACAHRTIEAARQDYRDVSTKREIERNLPLAWSKLLEEEDELLLTLVAEKVESLCGYKPSLDRVAAFLRGQRGEAPADRPMPPRCPAPRVSAQKSIPPSSVTAQGATGFTLLGTHYPARSAADVMRQVFRLLIERDPNFADRFAAMPQGKKRRFMARNREELFPGRADLQESCSVQMPRGWWLGLNVSKDSVRERIEMACQAAGISFGRDLIVHF